MDNLTPPPFGSNFNSNTNPPDPNNPYAPPQLAPISDHTRQVHTEQAKHKPRDAYGRFLPEHPPQTTPNPPTTPTPQTIPSPPTPSAPPIQVTHQSTHAASDPPLVDLKVTNPITYLKRWLTRILRNEGITIKIKPFTVAIIILALTGGSFSIGSYLFPHSSPIFHRQVVYQGSLQITDKGFFLTLPNSDLYTLRPKAKSSINFQSLQDGPALVKGNLTVEKFVIDVTEIIPLGTSTSSPTIQPPPPIPQTTSANTNLPELYPSITWETTQQKVLTFTSGKRRVELEGIYLESAKLTNYPYDFINYYLSQLQDKGFKQTLNKIDPDGITSSFEKKGIFFTFGVKNIYSGYKAFIEHN